jgi:5-methyltetrahydropteroyltriglutamate--homocysteine methyltransferase
MMRSEDRILATHVGSLVRPPELVDFLRKLEAGEPVDEAAYEACLKASIDEVVRQQVDAGVDIVADGEFSKGRNWAFYVHDRLGGIERKALSPDEAAVGAGRTTLSSRDREEFQEFYDEYDTATGLKGRLGIEIHCTDKITYTGHDQVQRDIANVKAAAEAAGAKAAFLPVVAPCSALPEVVDHHYGNDRDFVFGLAEALREEYKAITDAGLIVQIDDAFLPFMYERMVPPGTLADYHAWAEVRIDALNHALEGIPRDRARYHICWGSWNGPHMYDVEIKHIVDLLLKLNVGGLLFENANPRHAHEWKVWETVDVPEEITLIPGVISHATNVVEHPELVAERLVRLAGIVGRERVMGGTDCGFAQSPFAQRVHQSIMWAKLRMLAEGCRLASDELWGRKAA